MSELTEAVDNLTATVEGFRRDMRKIRRRFWWTLASVILDISLSCGLAYAVVQIQNTATTQRRNTAQARIASCEQYNLQQDGDVVKSDLQDQVLVKHLSPPPRSAERQRQVDDFLADSHDQAVKGNAHRDCSPEGIRRYLAATPTTKEKP